MIASLVSLVIALAVIGVIAWAVTIIPFIPAWAARIIHAVCGLVALIVVVNFLMGLVGHPLWVYGAA